MLEVGGGLDLDQEPLGPDHGGELGPQDLEGDLAIVLEVLGEIDGGHAAGTQLALDAVAIGQCSGEAVEGRVQRFTFCRSSSKKSWTRIKRSGRAQPTDRHMRKR